jgi:hypothetical protein
LFDSSKLKVWTEGLLRKNRGKFVVAKTVCGTRHAIIGYCKFSHGQIQPCEPALEDYDRFHVTQVSQLHHVRVKRHFLTHPLSVLTGLADAETVQKLAEENRNVITAEQMDSEQIVLLEIKMNYS